METENTIRTRLERGERVFGVRIQSFSTTLLHVLGQVDVEYGYLDLEHAGFSPYDGLKLERMQMAADNAGVNLVVRLPGSESAMIRKVLDAGIRTIMIPRVETAEEVERTIRASRFHYEDEPGERGFGTAPTNNWGIRPEGYTECEDETVLVGIMLEKATAVENVQEITSVPELGFVKIGMGDLSVSLGSPQEYENSEVQNAIESIQSACSTNGIPLGCGVSSADEAKEALQDGYQLIDVGGDVGIFRTGLKQRIEGVRQGNSGS